MNKQKHTPGPWEARYTNRHEVVKKVIDESDGREVSVFIADCDVNRFGEDKANARLIAAAPDLLAQCTDALNYVSGRPENWAIGLAENLRKAISKAEGKDE